MDVSEAGGCHRELHNAADFLCLKVKPFCWHDTPDGIFHISMKNIRRISTNGPIDTWETTSKTWKVTEQTFRRSHLKWAKWISSRPVEPVGNSVMPPTGAKGNTWLGNQYLNSCQAQLGVEKTHSGFFSALLMFSLSSKNCRHRRIHTAGATVNSLTPASCFYHH